MWNEDGDVGGKHVPVCSRGTVIYFFFCLPLLTRGSEWEWGRKERGEINSETASSDRSIVSELRWLSAIVMCWLLFAIVLLSRHFSWSVSPRAHSPFVWIPLVLFFSFIPPNFKLGAEGPRDQMRKEMYEIWFVLHLFVLSTISPIPPPPSPSFPRGPHPDHLGIPDLL